MNLEIVTDTKIIQIVAGIIVGVLCFFFGRKHEKKKNQKHGSTNSDGDKLKNVKTL